MVNLPSNKFNPRLTAFLQLLLLLYVCRQTLKKRIKMKKDSVNGIYLRRKNKLIMSAGTGKSSKRLIATLMKNIQGLGYIFEPRIIALLETYNLDELEAFSRFVVAELKKLKGADVVYEPMYPNFPWQIMEAGSIELYFNALIHYLSSGTILPEYEKEERLPLHELTRCTKIELGSEEDLVGMFRNLLQSSTSLSATDKEDLAWFLRKHPDFEILPENIPLKENIAIVATLQLERIKNDHELLSALTHYLKTATDVLRFAVALCDGDISLASNTVFKGFGRKQRRLILSLLESIANIDEDMARYNENWKRLGERLHPFEYEKQYPRACAVFKKLFEGESIVTFSGALQKLLIKMILCSLLKCLSSARENLRASLTCC